jgi:hypothetical protein
LLRIIKGIRGGLFVFQRLKVVEEMPRIAHTLALLK